MVDRMEHLEPRQLFAAPTNDEQYLVELINRGRLDPAAEAQRYNVALNEGLAAGTISTAARQPLAINPNVTDAARGHSQWMIANDVFAHAGSGGSNPGDRITAAGYAFSGSWGWGENIAWSGSTGGTPDVASTTAQLHRNLFVDTGIVGRGHRTNLMNPTFREIGAGVVTGNFQGYNSVMATEDFAYTGGNAFLTGVAFADTIANDNFYTPGEGLGGVTISAVRAGGGSASVSTWASGGYSLRLAPGTYTITASGGGLASPVAFSNVVIGSDNVKRDFTPGAGNTTPDPDPGDGGGTPVPPTPTPKPPTAKLVSVPAVKKSGATTYTFTVRYTDDTGVRVASIDSDDILVTGPMSFSRRASFVKLDAGTDGLTRLATYRFTAPGGYWDALDKGTYRVALRGSQVKDIAGTFAAARTLGSFTVAAPALPQAKLKSSVLTPRNARQVFSIAFVGTKPINPNSIDANDFRVTGPHGFDQRPIVLAVTTNASGTIQRVTYAIETPDNLWTAADNGTYRLTVRGNQVSDTSGNFVPPGYLGSVILKLL